MEAAGYVTLTRQSGLVRELQIVANNIANASTTGYRAEGLMFSEFIRRTEGGPSLSMANANIPVIALTQGPLAQTGGTFDFAIEGDGFFLVETPTGERLTRNGAFSLSANGDLVNADGFRLLDSGGAPVFIPPDIRTPGLAADGTLSSDGRPLSQLGLFRPAGDGQIKAVGGNLYEATAGVEPAPEGRIMQGFLEGSNVDPIGQIARLIEVQRAYEMGQSFLETENRRVRDALDSFAR